MQRLILMGAGGHGKVAADTARALGWQDIAFMDASFPERQTNSEWPIISHPDNAHSEIKNDDTIFVSVGDNTKRKELSANYMLSNITNLIHPSTWVSPGTKLGSGILIVAGCAINMDAVIGDGVILNTGCTVDHDCRIGAFTHISPGANLAGGVTVGEETWIGIGSCVREGITIGNNVKVAAGAVVVEDVPDNATVMGVPAKVV